MPDKEFKLKRATLEFREYDYGLTFKLRFCAPYDEAKKEYPEFGLATLFVENQPAGEIARVLREMSDAIYKRIAQNQPL